MDWWNPKTAWFTWRTGNAGTEQAWPMKEALLLVCRCANRACRSAEHSRTIVASGGLVLSLLVMLHFASPRANSGQDSGDGPSRRWSSESLGQWMAEQPARPLEPAVFEPAVSASSLTQAATTTPGLSDSPRNSAWEIVTRRDDYAVRRYRQGFFQRLQFSGTWIDRGGDDGLGVSNLDTALTVAIPLGSFDNLLLVTPGFEVDFLEGAPSLGLPSELYNVGVDLMWRTPLNDRWGSMLAIRPGLASDFQTSEDAFRITGRALVTWQWVPERLSLLFGVVYLDRNDLPILPGVGLIWTPTPDWRLDLIFPRPKLARRLAFLPRQREDWAYLGGSLGGRTWAVKRPSGDPDQLTMRDYRLYLGWERILDGGSGLFAEVGIALGRVLEFEDDPLEQAFGEAVLLRGGVTY